MSQITLKEWNYDSYKALCAECGTDSALLYIWRDCQVNFLCIECRDKKEDEPEEGEEE